MTHESSLLLFFLVIKSVITQYFIIHVEVSWCCLFNDQLDKALNMISKFFFSDLI